MDKFWKNHILAVSHLKRSEGIDKNGWNLKIQRKNREKQEVSGNRKNFRKIKWSYFIWDAYHMKASIKSVEIWRLEEIPGKPGKIRKPEKFPENKILILYLRSKSSNHMVKITFIWKFKKNPNESEKKGKFIFSELSLTK